jgi:hypothetical protein
MEQYKTGPYFYRNPKKSVLHLNFIDKPKTRSVYEFGVPEVQRHLPLHLFGTEYLQPTLPQTELLRHQLPIIQYRGTKPRGNLPEVNLFF